MLELKTIRENPTAVADGLAKKHVPHPNAAVERILELDTQRRQQLTTLEQQKADMNRLAKQIGVEMGKGNTTAADQLKAQTAALKQGIADGEAAVSALDTQLDEALVALPNLPHPSVPPGKTPEDNAIVYEHPTRVMLDHWKKPHWELAAAHGLIDLEAGVKLTGAGFPVYRGKGARLQRALINFFLDAATDAGYTEIEPPILVNAASAYATGQLPDKEGQMYYVERDDLYLIPTAEVPVTNLFRDVIVEPAELPVRLCGYTPCFRREAGSYGAHVRGLNRLHQFDKVEIVQIVAPEKSYEVLEAMRHHAESLLRKLELPYRTLLLCGGDMSFASAKTYDLEVWSAGQERWLEVSSVSNFETFQANRLKCRIRNADGKGTRLSHTLNGSALALPRIVAALLECHQQADGSIQIPLALRPYTGFDRIG